MIAPRARAILLALILALCAAAPAAAQFGTPYGSTYGTPYSTPFDQPPITNPYGNYGNTGLITPYGPNSGLGQPPYDNPLGGVYGTPGSAFDPYNNPYGQPYGGAYGQPPYGQPPYGQPYGGYSGPGAPYGGPVEPTTEANKYTIKANVPITLDGDYVEYLVDEERVIAKGSAEARHDRMDLIANNIEADMKKSVVFAQGNVIFWQYQPNGKLKKVTGDFLVYHIDTGDGFMRDAMVYEDPTVIKAPLVELSARKISAPEGAVWTSCDHDDPHWSIRVKKVTIYPNDYMVLDKPAYYLGHLPLFMLTHRVVDLRRHEQKDFKMHLGYTKVKGLYETIDWNYGLKGNRRQSGTLNVENAEKLGNYFRLNHAYAFGDRVQGTLALDRSEDAVRRELVERATLMGNLRLDARSNLNFNLAKFANDLNGVTMNDELNTALDLSHNTQNYSIYTRYKKRSDLLNDVSRVSSLDYLPEMTVTTNRVKFYKTPLYVTTRNSLGRRSEAYGGVLTERNMFDSTWQFDSNRFQPSKLSGLNFGGSYRLRRDNLDETQTVLDGNAVFTQKIGDEVNGNLRYNNTTTYGLYPFKSNTVQNQNQLNLSLTLDRPMKQFDKAELRSNLLQGNYDLNQSKFGGVSNDITWTWRKSQQHYWRLYLRGNYDMGETILSEMPFRGRAALRDLYIKYDLKDSDNLDFNAATTYDTQTHKYKTMNTRASFRLNPFWSITNDVIFDLEQRKLRNVNYHIVRDLHCWEVMMTTNPMLDEYFVQFGLKAFPGDMNRMEKSKETGKWRRVKMPGQLF